MGVLDVFNWQGVCVSPGGSIFDVTPEWTRLDTGISDLRVAEVQIRRGKQTEFDVTSAGSCTVGFHDWGGAVDPTLVDWIDRPFAFAVRNPLTGVWHPRFRGSVEDHRYNLHESEVKGDVTIEAVDLLAYLASCELAPGVLGDPDPPFGDPVPAQSVGYIFYDDTDVTGPQIRINHALDDAGWPSGLSSVFTGNINVLETVYSSNDSILAVILDAAEAEFPTIAAFLADRYGVACFRGRNARFSPAATAATATHWDFHAWTVGEGGIQIRPPYVVATQRSLIRNQATCWPHFLENGTPFPATDMPNQVISVSGGHHGIKPWSAGDLIVKNGITTGYTGPEECRAFANYIVTNYASPEPHVRQITFKTLPPGDPRAAALWPLLCQMDLGDQVTVTKSHPGGGGLSGAVYFVEGITETWRPLGGDLTTGYPYCEMTLDLSPAGYWTTPPELPE